jgi:hypothetical protein
MHFTSLEASSAKKLVVKKSRLFRALHVEKNIIDACGDGDASRRAGKGQVYLLFSSCPRSNSVASNCMVVLQAKQNSAPLKFARISLQMMS